MIANPAAGEQTEDTIAYLLLELKSVSATPTVPRALADDFGTLATQRHGNETELTDISSTRTPDPHSSSTGIFPALESVRTTWRTCSQVRHSTLLTQEFDWIFQPKSPT